MNTYEAFYRGQRITVQAATPYAAQLEAARRFKARKSYEVTVMLAALADGKPVIHSTAGI
jgi:hypothetical protein